MPKNGAEKFLASQARINANELNDVPAMFANTSSSVQPFMRSLKEAYDRRVKKGKGFCIFSPINIAYNDAETEATVNIIGNDVFLKIEKK